MCRHSCEKLRNNFEVKKKKKKKQYGEEKDKKTKIERRWDFII